MSTRTAIFKEQVDGTFQGIYCQSDGYIEGVGAMLYNYYQDTEKVQRLIDYGKALSNVGISEKVRIIEYANRPNIYNEDGIIKYCFAVNDFPEKFVANDLEQIRTFNYLTLKDNDVIDGYQQNVDGKDTFVPYRGSDNNGFLYVQKQSGQWLVSTMKRNDDMTKFQQLKKYFSN
mgnify:FL=1